MACSECKEETCQNQDNSLLDRKLKEVLEKNKKFCKELEALMQVLEETMEPEALAAPQGSIPASSLRPSGGARASSPP
ncbi:hypothetical protein L345_05307 [Ophiophagus hannah]|uniref:Uncharacterized protein n=1 Tax=Ophiophagus hannah TaxID=8665 RepID=V8P2X6_OPHHA|nr:hypothetical protein L345_05307 [Ophiophagus hannah]